MKKNSSLKTIRANIVSPTNVFKPVMKKPSYLDLLSCKHQQAPSTINLNQKYNCPIPRKPHMNPQE